ncbi:MAG: spore coat protein U domain-containing protein [Rhodanobacter sp.]
MLFLLLMVLGLWWPTSGHAQNVNCTATMGSPAITADLVNGTGGTAMATLTYTCKNSSSGLFGSNYYASVCFNVGDGAQGLSHFNPRVMTDAAADALQFQIYTNAGYTQIWGSIGNAAVPNPYEVIVGPIAKGGGTITGTWTIYASLINGQTNVPSGSYQDQFSAAGGHTSITHAESTNHASLSLGTCQSFTDTGSFPFAVTASITKSCNVSATSDMIFANAASMAINVAGTSSVQVTCSPSVAYDVGLAPSAANGGNANGGGRMISMTAPATNTDKVPYQLYQNLAHSVVWGNTTGANTLTTANGLAAGTGLPQTYSVYGVVPSANFTPDTYQDTVTVTVTY